MHHSLSAVSDVKNRPTFTYIFLLSKYDVFLPFFPSSFHISVHRKKDKVLVFKLPG